MHKEPSMFGKKINVSSIWLFQLWEISPSFHNSYKLHVIFECPYFSRASNGEYKPYAGDLLGYLRKSRGLNDTFYKDPDMKPQTTLKSQQLLKFDWQVTDG